VDAELLLAHVLDVPRPKLLIIDEVNEPATHELEGCLLRRIEREPLQYIIGTAPFRHIELAVGPGVFIPRPETELLVDAVLPALRRIERPVVVDLCSGSGALALAIADEIPGSRVVAVENSPEAVAWLRKNVMSYLVSADARSSVAIETEDVTDPALFPDLRGLVDVVVSNPPYVPAGTEISPEVQADPAEAVFSGEDGLELTPSVIARAAELLKPGGVFAVEHDDSTQAGVLALLAADGRWRDIVPVRDLADRPRSVTALRR
jgi:release factor glutamine methyltransferase